MFIQKIIFSIIFMVITPIGCQNEKMFIDSADKLPVEDIKGEIAFVNVNVVPMNEEKILTNHTVIIRDGLILEVGPSSQIMISDSASVIDGAGKYLMPGLTDMHTHVFYEEDLLPYVANGVTTILNLGSPSNILQFRDRVLAGELLGPTIFASAFVDGPGSRGWEVRTPDEAEALVSDLASLGWDFIKVYNSISTDVFTALMDAAKQNGISVVGHIVVEPGLEKILDEGQVMIAHAEEYLWRYFNRSTNSALIPTAVQITRDNEAYVIPNLSAFDIIDQQRGNPSVLAAMLSQPEIRFVHPNWLDNWRNNNPYVNQPGNQTAWLDFLKQLTKALHDSGVPLLLGTDSPWVSGVLPGYSIHIDLQNLVSSGLSPYQALRTGTINAGEFIQKHRPGAEAFGTIEAGRQANIVLLYSNPLEDISNVSNRVGVMVRGRWLSEGWLLQLLEELVLSF